jgi:hypothetical protein
MANACQNARDNLLVQPAGRILAWPPCDQVTLVCGSRPASMS